MSIQPASKINKVNGIDPKEKEAIRVYLKGAVYTWDKNKNNEPFSARDLVGGINFNWNSTPLQCLYNKHIRMGKNHKKAVKAAGIDLGWLLKDTLNSDKRNYFRNKGFKAMTYRWDRQQ